MNSPLLARLLQLRAAASSTVGAVVDDEGRRPLGELLDRAAAIAGHLQGQVGLRPGDRVVLLASPSGAWVETFFAILLAGGVAVPLSPSYPAAELVWFADDAAARLVLVSPDLRERAEAMGAGRELLALGELSPQAHGPAGPSLPTVEADAAAMLLYTSGTTGRPKGAIITHQNIATQAEIMGAAWAISPADLLLHALPLHHLHGLCISLLNALLAGASARLLPRFDAPRIWDELATGRVTLWMAVPTMYQKLLEALEGAPPEVAARWAQGARNLRLATSGSAALPVRLAERWRAITGSIPLERFGMTEIGVGLTNPLDPAARRPGWVGRPPRSVELRIVDEGGRVIEVGEGELQVRGPSLFGGYWRRPEATAAAFRDGWFLTGDRARRDSDGWVRLLGRTSVDILKSGGYKLSALEIEEALREHDGIREVAVVGLPDETWGERVVAAVVPEPGRDGELTTESVRAWAKERLAPYKIPRQVVLLPALPKNALGKVVKPEVIEALTRR